MNLLNHHLARSLVASFASGVNAGHWFHGILKMLWGAAFNDLEVPIVQDIANGVSSVRVRVEHPK